MADPLTYEEAIRIGVTTGVIGVILTSIVTVFVARMNRRTTLESITRANQNAVKIALANNETAVKIADQANITTLQATRESNVTTLSALNVSRTHDREKDDARRRRHQIEEIGLEFVIVSENCYEIISQSLYTTFPKPEYGRNAIIYAHRRIAELQQMDVFNGMRRLRARAQVLDRTDLAKSFEEFMILYFKATTAIQTGEESLAHSIQTKLMSHGDKTISLLYHEQKNI